MGTPNIMVQVKDSIAEIVLNRPEKRNAISNQMGEELVAALDACSKDRKIKVIILRGEGKSFCAGRDLGELSGSQETALQLYTEESILERIFLAMKSLRKPIIAATHGFTMGGGIGLLAMSHFVVAAEDAKFALPEINFGLFPLGVNAVLWQTIGPKKTLQLALIGEQFDAEDALRMGLVDYTIPVNELISKAWELAKKLSQKKDVALLAGIDAYNVLTEEDFRTNFKIFKLMLIPFILHKPKSE